MPSRAQESATTEAQRPQRPTEVRFSWRSETFLICIRTSDMHAPVEPHTPSEPDFADIYKTHYRRVFGLCRYLLNSFDAAEDATHEVFLRAQRKLATYDRSLPFSSWLSGIASNHCIDLLRRRSTEKRIFEDGGDNPAEPPTRGVVSPLNELIASERGQDVRKALSELP